MSNYKVDITGINTNQLSVLSSEETLDLIRMMKGDQNIKDRVVMGNLKLVLSAIKPYRNRNICLDDLFQVGVIGLIKAIDNFDISKDVMFSTYAVPMIKGEIKRYMRDSSSLLKVSRQIKDLSYQVYKARQELVSDDNHSPTVEEIAKYLDIPVKNINQALESYNPVLSFSDPLQSVDGDEITLTELVSDNVSYSEKILTRLTLKEAIRNLDEMERKIIDKRYFEGLTQMEIAQEFDISQAQVSRLEKQALRTLKRYF